MHHKATSYWSSYMVHNKKVKKKKKDVEQRMIIGRDIDSVTNNVNILPLSLAIQSKRGLETLMFTMAKSG